MANMDQMSPAAKEAFARLQTAYGKDINPTSAHRSHEHNKRVGGAKNSQHLHGNAYDISTAGMSPEEVQSISKMAMESGFRGLGVYDDSLHFDIGKQRTWGSDYTSNTAPEWAKGLAGGTYEDMVDGSDANPTGQGTGRKMQPEEDEDEDEGNMGAVQAGLTAMETGDLSQVGPAMLALSKERRDSGLQSGDQPPEMEEAFNHEHAAHGRKGTGFNGNADGATQGGGISGVLDKLKGIF